MSRPESGQRCFTWLLQQPGIPDRCPRPCLLPASDTRFLLLGVKFCRESCLWKMVVPLTAHARAMFSHVFPPSILFKPKNTGVVSPGSSVCSSVSRLLSGFQFESPKILERICFFGTEFCLFIISKMQRRSEGVVERLLPARYS